MRIIFKKIILYFRSGCGIKELKSGKIKPFEHAIIHLKRIEFFLSR